MSLRALVEKPLFLAVVVGGVYFQLFMGLSTLFPENISWLPYGDPSQHYLGWLFYRNSPWEFPVGSNPTYGLEAAKGIIFTDSIPIFALFFKSISFMLPPVFQYFGIWCLTVFVLQIYFAVLIFGRLGLPKFQSTVGAMFIGMAPVLLFRVGSHMALMAHFIILWAIYVSLSNPQGLRKRLLNWLPVLGVAALVHPYFVGMVAAIWLTNTLAFLLSTKKLREFIWEVASVFTLVLFLFWQIGVVGSSDAASAWGFGYFKFDLLSPLNPMGWSHFLVGHPSDLGEYEGFSYLGLGLLILGGLGIWTLIGSRAARRTLVSVYRSNQALVLSVLLMASFALSNRVSIGGITLEGPLPAVLSPIYEAFRASGRFIWPIYYLVVIVLITIFLKHNARVRGIAVALLLAVAQVVDLSAGWAPIRSNLQVAPAPIWETGLNDTKWHEIFDCGFSSVVAVPPKFPPFAHPHWREIGYLAGVHGLSTNIAYLARGVSQTQLSSLADKGMSDLISGKLRADSIYILERGSAHDWLSLSERKGHMYFLDEMFLLSPVDLDSCSTNYLDDEIVNASEVVELAESGVRFSGVGLSSFLASGWQKPEEAGSWSDNGPSRVLFRVENDTRSLNMNFDFQQGNVAKSTLRISLNGSEVDSSSISSDGVTLKLRLDFTSLQKQTSASTVDLLIESRKISDPVIFRLSDLEVE